MEKIKIMPSVKFDLDDLLREVDFTHSFTLRDLFRMVKNSKIPIEIIQNIIHCNNIGELFIEADSKPFVDKDNIEYLEVYWSGSKDTYEGILESSSSWCFHGVGYLGVVSNEDVNPIDPVLKETFREKYAIEMSPMYHLADYIIKMSPKMSISDWDDDSGKDNSVDFQPSISLIELIQAIFWELSFFGSINERDSKREELEKTAEELHTAIEEGRIDEVTVPWEKVEEHIEELKSKFKKE